MHEQLAQLLRARVATTEPGGTFATEAELMHEFGVSRATVRRSLGALVDEGLLARQRGKGTFVRDRAVHSLDRLRPFVTMFTEAGHDPTGTLVAFEWVGDPGHMPAPIASSGEAALHVRRLYEAPAMAPAIADMYVPAVIAENITRRELEEHPIYQVIENKFGMPPAYADVVVRSETVGSESAALRCDPESPMLVVERTSFHESGQMLECTMFCLRPDAVELRLRVRAQGPVGGYHFPNDIPQLVPIDNPPPTASGISTRDD